MQAKFEYDKLGLPISVDIVDNSLTRFEGLAKSDRWWEVQAQLLQVAAKLVTLKQNIL